MSYKIITTDTQEVIARCSGEDLDEVVMTIKRVMYNTPFVIISE